MGTKKWDNNQKTEVSKGDFGLFVLHDKLRYTKAYLYVSGSDAVEMGILTMQERQKINKREMSLLEDRVQSSWASLATDMISNQFH